MLSLLRSRRGFAALEFAIVGPVLVAMLCGVVDLSDAILMTRRLSVAADSVAMIASTFAVQASTLNTLSGYQAWQASTAPFALFPLWATNTKAGAFSITLSAVTFSTANAGFAANVAWSVANPAGQPRLRACGSPSAVADSAASSLSSLPADAFSATALLVADVSAVFTPMFSSVFLGPLTLQRSAYVSPRVDNGVTLLAGFPGPSVLCSVPK